MKFFAKRILLFIVTFCSLLVFSTAMDDALTRLENSPRLSNIIAALVFSETCAIAKYPFSNIETMVSSSCGGDY